MLIGEAALESDIVSEVTSQGGVCMPAAASGSKHGSVGGCGSGSALGGANASGSFKGKKRRRMASQIKKEYKCMYCEKFYGSSAAAIMHMRKKHHEGTK